MLAVQARAGSAQDHGTSLLLTQVAERRVQRVRRAQEVDFDEPPEIVEALLAKAAGLGDPGIGHHGVEPAEGFECGVQQPFSGLGILHAAVFGHGAPPGSFDLLDDCSGGRPILARVPAIVHHYPGSEARKVHCIGPAQPLAGAGYGDNLAFESVGHFRRAQCPG